MVKSNRGLKTLLRDAGRPERASVIDGLPYEVGFGKPPKQHRFSSERQPERRGRPKGSENMASILTEELAAAIEVTEGGKRRRRSKQRVAVVQLVNKAASGDIKALALLIELIRKAGLWPSAETKEASAFDARDLEAMQRIAQMLGMTAPSDSPEIGDRS
jgi:hypothetical protein